MMLYIAYYVMKCVFKRDSECTSSLMDNTFSDWFFSSQYPYGGEYNFIDQCKEFPLWLVFDSVNIYFRGCPKLKYWVANIWDYGQNFNLRYVDALNIVIYLSIFCQTQTVQKYLQRASQFLLALFERKQPRKNWKRILDYHYQVDWFYHSCFYDHKDMVKKIVDKHHNDIDINLKFFEGNTALHLAAYGNNISTVQILIKSFSKEIDYSLKNNQGLNPLEVAISRKKLAVIKLLVPNTKEELSTLLEAIKTDQYDLASKFCKSLQGQIQNEPDLLAWIEQLIKEGKELETKKSSKDRKEILKKSLSNLKSQIEEKLIEINKIKLREKEILEKLKSKSSEKPLKSFQKTLNSFECPICMEYMTPPRKIYACSQDHWICSLCLMDPKITTCPQCREDFTSIKPERRLANERMLSRMIKQSVK